MGRSGFPAQLLIVVLALFGATYLVFSADGPPPRVSGWAGHQQPAGLAAPAAVQGQGLTGLAQAQQGQGLPGTERPSGNPLQDQRAVMTQGYGVGSHAPAATWGAIDLAIDGDGDGAADPGGSWNHPIYATHDGVAKVTPNSYPAGNHVWVSNEQFRTGYSHLADIVVTSGQQIRRGDLIGHLGSTGMSSGPHLDYQVWERRGGDWVNVNPLEYGAADGAGR